MSKKYKRLWAASTAAFAVSSLAVLLLMIPIRSQAEGQSPMSILCGLLFWAGIIAGIVLWALIYKSVHEMSGYKKIAAGRLPGAAAFFKNPAAKVFDLLMAVSFVLVIIGILVIPTADIYNCLCIAVLLFSIEMHCLFNGKVYAYISMNRRKKKDER